MFSHIHHPDRKNLIIAGLVAIILGLLAILAPTITGLSLVMLVGFLVTGAGAARMYWAIKTHHIQQGGLLFLLGGLTFAAGIVMIIHPVIASGIFSVILTMYLILDGISEIYAASVVKPNPGWLVMGGAGVISILLGLMMWSHFPFSGAWTIGLFLGIKLLLIGAIVLYTYSPKAKMGTSE